MNSFNKRDYYYELLSMIIIIICRVQRFSSQNIASVDIVRFQFNSISMKTIAIGGKVSLCLIFAQPINSIIIFTVELE